MEKNHPKNSLKKFLDPQRDPDRHQNLTARFQSHIIQLLKQINVIFLNLIFEIWQYEGQKLVF